MSEDDENYICSGEALDFIETAERLQASFEPMPPATRRKSTRKKAKSTKQPKIKQAFRKVLQGPKNFQGVPIDKCITDPVLGPVFIHKNYTAAWNKAKKSRFIVTETDDEKCCPDCFLMPCSARVLKEKLTLETLTVDDLTNMTAAQMTKKLHFHYRIGLTKLQGKVFVTKAMKTDDDVPVCAKKLAAKIVNAEYHGGYESWLEDDKYYPYTTFASYKRKQAAAKKAGSKTSENDDESSCFDEEEEWNPACDHDGTIQTQAN